MAHRTKTVGLAVGTLAVLQLVQDVDFVHQHLPSWSLGSLSRSTVSLALIASFILLLRLQANESAEDATNSNTNTNTSTASPTQTANPNIVTNINLPPHTVETPKPLVQDQLKHNMQYFGSKLLLTSSSRATVIVAYFKNVGIANKPLATFKNAQANITYSYHENSDLQVVDIVPAKWLDNFGPRINFAVGETKAVIVAVWNNGRWCSREVIPSTGGYAGGYSSRDTKLPFGQVRVVIAISDRTTGIEPVHLILTLNNDETATITKA
jgi:hypothetical protein